MEDNNNPDLLSGQIQRFIPFDELSIEAIGEISTHFRSYQVAPRSILFKRGVHDDECHFLLDGEIDLTDDQFRVTTICGDDDENFLALDSSHPIHRATAISKTPCQLIAIRRQLLELITTWSELRQSYEMDESESDWLETLLTSELFNRIPPANIQKLLSRFDEREVSLGDEIIREGEEGSECFVIKSGKALVTRNDNNKPETLAALGQGSLFGEDALISNMPRNATVTMSSNGVLMSLTKDDFDTLLKAPVLEFVTAADLASLIDEGDTGTVLLDVRQQREASLNPIARAKCIPLGVLRSQLPSLSRSFQYVICGAGRAEAAAYILTEAGYQAKVLLDDDS